MSARGASGGCQVKELAVESWGKDELFSCGARFHQFIFFLVRSELLGSSTNTEYLLQKPEDCRGCIFHRAILFPAIASPAPNNELIRLNQGLYSTCLDLICGVWVGLAFGLCLRALM